MITNTDDPDVIERELAETRSRLDQRLDELQEKLSPGQMVNETISYLGGGQNGTETADRIISLAKANPVPAMLIGAGIAWLVVGRFTPRRKAPPHQGDAAGWRAEDIPAVARDPLDTDASYEWRLRKARASAHEGRGKIRGAVHQLANKVSNSARVDGVRSTKSGLDGAIVIGGIAAAAGLLAGLLLPVTEQEENWLRDAADDLRATGGDLGQRLVDRGSEAARQAVGAAAA